MTHFFLSSVSYSFGIVVESLNLVGCSSDILSMSIWKPTVTFNPVWRAGNGIYIIYSFCSTVNN